MDEVHLRERELQPVSNKYFNMVWREQVPQLKVRVFHGCVCVETSVGDMQHKLLISFGSCCFLVLLVREQVPQLKVQHLCLTIFPKYHFLLTW